MYQIRAFLLGLIEFYELLIIAWCILSWIPRSPDGLIADIQGALDTIVGGYVRFFRNLIPSMAVGLDFSPIFAILALQLLSRVIIHLI